MSESKQVLITGRAGFIGSHAARSFLDRGAKVRAYDNMSRVGSDLGKARADFGWSPETGVEDGMRCLYDWAQANRELLVEALARTA